MIQRFFALCKNPAIVIFCGSLLLGGCGGNVTAEDTKLVMGTVARLTVRADEITSQAALRDGLAVLMQTEEDADGAILATVESSAGTGAWTGLPPDLYETLRLAQEIARRSNGAFDVTAGTLTQLWERARVEKLPPSPEAVADARARVGYEALELRTRAENGQTKYEARLMKAGMRFDRGALIKGLALDGIRRNWTAAGITNALADLGTSSILGMGVNAERTPWQIGIRNPRGAGNHDLLTTLALSDEVLSSSGDDERFFVYEGQRYHHLIDPRTGYPAMTGLASVTVVLPMETNVPEWQEHTGLLADMLSTAIFVLGATEGRHILAHFPVSRSIFVDTNGQMIEE